MRFKWQEFLVKQNGDIIRGEIKGLIKEAEVKDIKFGEKMFLLDIASAMAKMNIEWNKGDRNQLDKIEVMQAEEVLKANKRQAVLDKIKKTESTPGNFVLNVHKQEMIDAGLKPVIYPHWVHRMFFRCKVCHEDLEIMERGANKLSQAQIEDGKTCGACHNGTVSFDASLKVNCEKCHMYGTPKGDSYTDLSRFDAKEFAAIAERLGAKLNVKNIKDGELPKDKFGDIQWVEMVSQNIIEPLSSLGDHKDEEGVRATDILFDVPFAFMKDVQFSHKIHSSWVKCSLCHDRIFKKELGAAKVRMVDMKKGESCGTCHGKIAFKVADCKRCHSYDVKKPVKGILIRPIPEPEPEAEEEEAAE
jgi:c(7)-type cytochrome triheme protein